MDKYNKALEYEIFVKKEYGFADQSIKQAEIIFDVGGHIGLFSEYCLFLNPGCEIHYFEPISKLYNQAKQKLNNHHLSLFSIDRQDRIRKSVVLNNFGISAKSGEEKIYFNSEKTMQTSKFNQTFLNPKGEEINVQMQNLEEYCVQKNISRIDLLKIDVEGMEYEIIESFSDEFLQKIQALMIEYHCFDSKMEKKFKKIEQKLSNYFIGKKMFNKYDSRLGYLFYVIR